MPSDAPHASWHPALMPNVAPGLDRSPSPPPSNLPDDDVAGDSQPVADSFDRSPSPPPSNLLDDDVAGDSEPAVDSFDRSPSPPPSNLLDDEAAEDSQPVVSSFDRSPSPPASHLLDDEAAGDSELVADSLDPAEDVLDKSLGPDAWFPDYETGDNGLADASNVPPPTNDTIEASNIAEQEEPHPEPASATKHLSTVSFARTVSHDVNWTDEEDAEPSLSRVDTDPFKFMPPSDRTNSFPAVPPLEQPKEPAVEQPLPSNQAEDVIHEIEQHQEHVDSSADFASAFQESHEDSTFTGDSIEDNASHQYIGGHHLEGTSEEASEARYTEGLPLIPQTREEESHDPPSGPTDEFAAEDDDFFSQIRDTGDSEPRPFEPESLERKSTAQVLNGLRMGDSGSNIPTVVEAQEEDETASGTVRSLDAPAEIVREYKEEAAHGEGGEDLDAKWKAMFSGDDDDDLLLDDGTGSKEVDPAAFFGSDDEGFLEDQEDGPAPQVVEVAPQPAPSAPNERYLPPTQPAGSAIQAPVSYPVQPTYAPGIQPPAPQFPTTFAPPSFGTPQYGAPGAQTPSSEPNKAQSFAAKAKGGYTSPYDLPMDVVKPRKRVSMQNLQRPSAAPAAHPGAPPRSSSMYNQPLPTSSSVASLPASSLEPRQVLGPQTANPKPPLQTSKPQEAFFEELPTTSRPRPTSRQSNKSLPSPSQTSPYGAQTSQPPPPMAPPPPVQYAPAQPPATSVSHLVAPERVSPYAPLQTSPGAPSLPPATSNRYSPAPTNPPQPNATAPPAAATRYSPAPPGSRSPSASYAPAQGGGVTPPVLPHQPRTSSPLAHFETSHDPSRSIPANHAEAGTVDRRSSSGYELRSQRVPSLPPTREVEEEEGPPQLQAPPQGLPRTTARPNSGYSQSPYQPRQIPQPPVSTHPSFSPPKRTMSSYRPTQDPVPPPRSQTQSPGARYGNRVDVKPMEPIARPSSVHSPTSPRMAPPLAVPMQQAPVPELPSSTRARGASQNLNLILPTDGREQDPLQRWRGVPLIAWGLGGTVVTMFPKDVPRYGMNHSVPMIVRSPGEVKVSNVKDVQPLEERLAKFPGPLKGKSKKKETLAWLNSGIEALEATLPHNLSLQPHASHEDKRAVERVLLWKILRLFIEHDGSLDDNPAVEEGVRAVLSPNLGGQALNAPLGYATAGNMAAPGGASAPRMHSDGVDPSAIEEIRNHLLVGAREKAVWVAADKRLWGHALLIANTVSPELYKQVTREFVRKEVNYPGHNNESLATLYEVLSGNHEECVDELVPVHARAGLQLIAKDTAMGPSKDAMEGLDNWQETLGLILSNRSTDDTRAINSLGNLLSSYGRAEAAHICFIFARNHTVFGGFDDPASNFVLVGSDHKQQAQQFSKEIEPLLLSEVYEYGLSLAGGPNATVHTPHLAAYKLQHALTLAEYGYRQKALQYCETITNAITAQTRRSQYHHIILELTVDDLSKRLKQSPKEESNSWITKPSMNKVSDSVWDRFNKFVAGDESENSGQRSPVEGAESGPFARIVGGTPTISRPPSASGYEPQGGGVPGYPMTNGPIAATTAAAAPTLPPTRAASRYAPVSSQPAAVTSNPYEPNTAYAPRSSMERHSGELNRGSFEAARRSSEMHAGHSNAYTPNSAPPPTQSYQPNHVPGGGALSRESSYMPVAPAAEHISQPPVPQASAMPGYEPHGKVDTVPNGSPYELSRPASEEYTGGAGNNSAISSEAQQQQQQPPSYGYEPPSFTPYEAPAEKEAEEAGEATSTGYEPPTYQPYGYEPPSYEPDSQGAPDGDSDSESNPKPKRGIMYDGDEDDVPGLKPQGKTKEEKDRENAEMFRKAAEEDEKRAAEAKQAKKGWGFTGWFGGAAKKDSLQSTPNKPIRAKLGEENSFVYDPDQKRWINKKGGTEDTAAKTATPPPPKGPPRSAASTPPPHLAGPGPGRASAPPGGPGGPPRPSVTSSPSGPGAPPATTSAGPDGKLTPGPAAMMRTVSNTSSASQPPRSISTASSIDDLLSAAPRPKGAAKKPRKSGRYIDVMAKS